MWLLELFLQRKLSPWFMVYSEEEKTIGRFSVSSACFEEWSISALYGLKG